jgi:HD-GYP domain-containing protein (c-di-GMP phosphodiesterase class II)
MVLGRPVYDSTGNVLLDSYTELGRRDLATLAKNRVAEIFIEDRRTADVLVHCPIAPELEAAAAKALSRLIAECRDHRETAGDPATQVEQAINAMARELFPEILGEPNLSGCLSMEDYDYVQPAKVASLAMVMGRKAGYAIPGLAGLGLASLLMNLGYTLALPGTINTPNSLAEKVCQEIPRHPQRGAEILGQHRNIAPEVIEAVLQHHERWDGSGYPGRLKGAEILHSARIIAIADTYYELVSKRPDRPAYMPHEAVEFILAYNGELFDPELAQLFTRVVPLYPTGTTVRLSTGEAGIGYDANLGHIGRPVVRLCTDARGGALSHPRDINLASAEYQRRLIVAVDSYLSPYEG